MSIFLQYPSGYTASSRFDSLMKDIQIVMNSFAQTLPQGNVFPFFNVKGDFSSAVVFEFSVPGFTMEQLSVRRDMDSLVISGHVPEPKETDGSYVVRRIAHRNFERSFYIPDYCVVDRVWLENGILSVSLHAEVPEHLKPQHFQIEHKTEEKGP